MIGVNVWWVYLAPQHISRAIVLMILGNEVVLYCMFFSLFFYLKTSLYARVRKRSGIQAKGGNKYHFLETREKRSAKDIVMYRVLRALGALLAFSTPKLL